jgi:glycolate oxidase iron-sulfur subunit
LAWNAFLDAFQSKPTAKADSPRVALFVGCGANYLFPDVARALVNILEHLEVDVVVPGNQVCCGLPAHVSGDVETTRELARNNIQAFESLGVETILTVCASCGSHLASLESLFADDSSMRDAAASLAKKHMDAMAFLVDRLHVEQHLEALKSIEDSRSSETSRVAYHDPCHLRIGQGIKEAPRRLLSALPGLKLVEASHAGQCCGHGGDFNLCHFSLSMTIADRRVRDFEKAEVDRIVTGCTGCLLQFTEGINRRGLQRKVEVCHPLLLLEKAIALDQIPAQKQRNPRVSQARNTGAGQ